MAIALTEPDFYDFFRDAQAQGEQIRHPLDLGYRLNIPQRLGQGSNYTLSLSRGLGIDVINTQLRQPFAVTRQHGHSFPIIAKFYLSGGSRIKTPPAAGVKPDYEEVSGCSYLYHLPDITEIEVWDAAQVVMIYAPEDYFRDLNPVDRALPQPLQSLMRHDTRRFHQPLGKMTPLMMQVVQQILDCPYQGSAQRLYLESKAMELFALQFAHLEADPPAAKPLTFKAADLERVQYAKELLIQRIDNPLSLPDLARRTGLNECTLKRGFRHLFGQTVFGYLRDYRMQLAQNLLRSPDVTVAEVAARVGYVSPEGFSTAFRRRFSVSPKAYQLGRRG